VPVGNAAVSVKDPNIGAQIDLISLAITFQDVIITFMIDLEAVEYDSEDARRWRAPFILGSIVPFQMSKTGEE